ncbi:MAG: EamA family transporter [Gammaproteobacteria bacterium]|nr:EamA family transporter [Gammaproteobacteria bacterium]
MGDLTKNWFFWAIISMLLQGMHAFLYKKLIEDRGDHRIVQVLIPAVVCIMASIALYVEDHISGLFVTTMAVIASVQGVLFYLTTAMRIEALRSGTPAHIVFPIVKSSVVFIIILSAFLFNEWESLQEPRRLTGILLAVFATFSLMEWRLNLNRQMLNRGVAFAMLAMISGGGAALMAKYLFITDVLVSIFAFMLLSNLTTLFLSMLSFIRSEYHPSRQAYDTTIVWGVVMGILSFGGFAAFLQAIKVGDLSAVASVSALAILIPVLLSAWLYRERLTLRKEIAVFISIIALALIS